MALSNNSSSGLVKPLTILKPETKNDKKEKVSPHFSVTKKIDGKWTKITDTYTNVAGNLTRVELKEKTYQDTPYTEVLVYLDDGTESFMLDLRFTVASRNLFNMLANLQTGEDLKVSYYEAKNGYDRYSLRQGDELVGWKHSMDVLPKPIEVTFKGKTQRDYTPVDDFLKKELQELNDRINKGRKMPTNPRPSAQKPTSQPTDAAPEVDEPVPF